MFKNRICVFVYCGMPSIVLEFVFVQTHLAASLAVRIKHFTNLHDFVAKCWMASYSGAVYLVIKTLCLLWCRGIRG